LVSGNDGIVWYFRIQEEDVGSVVVLRLEGRVSSATSGDLAQALERFSADGRRALVVDVSAVDYINGQGLSILEAAATRLRSANGDLIVCGLSPVVRTAFDLGGALGRMTVESSPEDALRRATGLNGS
jgi:anti-anti-sigma factor